MREGCVGGTELVLFGPKAMYVLGMGFAACVRWQPAGGETMGPYSAIP